MPDWYNGATVFNRGKPCQLEEVHSTPVFTHEEPRSRATGSDLPTAQKELVAQPGLAGGSQPTDQPALSARNQDDFQRGCLEWTLGLLPLFACCESCCTEHKECKYLFKTMVSVPLGIYPK